MKPFSSWSIRAILLLVVILTILPCLGIVLYNGLESRSRAIAEAKARILRMEQRLSANQERALDSTRQFLMILAKLPTIRDRVEPDCDSLLKDLLAQNPCYANILAADPGGLVFASALPSHHMNVSDRKYFRDAMASRSFSVGEYAVGRSSGKPVIHFALPSMDARGRVRAIIIAAFDLNFYGRLFSQERLPAGSALALTDLRGTRLFRTPNNDLYSGGRDLPEMMRRMSGGAAEGSFIARGVDGVLRFYAFKRLRLDERGPALYMRVGIPAEKVVAEANSAMLRNLAFMGTATLLAMLAAWFLGDSLIARRLARLVDASRRLGEGVLSVRTGLNHGEGELGRLAQSFDEMAGTLEMRETERVAAAEALRESEERLLRLNRTLRMLLKCNEALVRATNEGDLLREICRIITENGGYSLAWVGFAEHDEARSVRCVAQCGADEGAMERLGVTWDDTEKGRGLVGTVIRDGLPCLVKDIRNDPFCIPWLEGLSGQGHLSVLSIPLAGATAVLGALSVYAAEPDAFDDTEVNLLVQLAGEVSYGICSLRIASEHGRVEEALIASENNLAEAQAIAHLGSWEYDLERDEEFRSAEFFRILGLPPREDGRAHDSVFDYIHLDDLPFVQERITATLEKGDPYDVEYRIMRPDGGERVVHARGKALADVDGKITRFIGTILDITERKKLEQKFLQAQKMEAVGQLAGGIAHDFNNILTAIIGYQHLLLDRVEDDKARHYAKQVTTLAERAGNLTRDLLMFSRKQTYDPKPQEMNDIIRKVGKLLMRLIGEEIEFRTVLHDGPLQVRVVSGQMEQVLMNLATNARDAMPNGGALTVRTELVRMDGEFIAAHGYGTPGDYALISVSDTGTGMDEKVRTRVFEPFFTTKEVGKGTGLGLATAYGIIEQHGGHITVYSELGEGTTFRIFIPLSQAGAGGEEGAKEHIFPARGTETVLLAEDEPEVREQIRSLLDANGYRVIVAVDGEHALEKYLEHDREIDILLLDVIMPKRNGRDVYDAISKARPDMKAIFISGYTADIIERKGIPKGCRLVTKPFSPHALLGRLRDVLDVGGQASA